MVYMRILTIVALAAILTACQTPDHQASSVRSAGPTVPVSTPTNELLHLDHWDATERPTDEASRLAEWDGTGDKPYGDGPNDGRFADIQCGCQSCPDPTKVKHPTCWYSDGTQAAQSLTWRGNALYWDSHYLGTCVERIVVWNYKTTSPECERER